MQITISGSTHGICRLLIGHNNQDIWSLLDLGFRPA
jgi:hypothetical protein